MAINEAWDENYGQGGGVPGRANIPFTVPVDNATVTFTYDATTHVLTIVAEIAGAPAAPARSRLRLARRTASAWRGDSKVWYSRRTASSARHVLPDGRQHERRDAPVRRHRRLHVHRPADARHDLPVEARPDSGGMALHGGGDCDERQVPDRDRLRHGPGSQLGGHAGGSSRPSRGLQLYARFDATVNGNGGGGAGNGGADRATIDESTGDPVLVSFDPVPRDERSEPRLCSPVYAALDGLLGGVQRLRGRSERRARPGSTPRTP